MAPRHRDEVVLIRHHAERIEVVDGGDSRIERLFEKCGIEIVPRFTIDIHICLG